MPRRPRPWFRTGKGRWYVQIDGKQVALPATDPADEAAAWEAFKRLVARADSGTAPEVKPGPIAALIPAYVEQLRPRVAPRTLTGYAGHLRRFGARFGSVPAAAVDPAAVAGHATEQGWSDSNRHNYLWAVQAFVRWCGRKDFALDRPPKDSRGAEAVISEAAHRAVLRETRGDLHQLCRLLWECGARPMEAASLTAEGIDWASGTATLRKHKTKKRGGARILYFNQAALAVLEEQRARHGSGPLFRGQGGGPFTLRALVGRMCRVQERAGVRATLYGYRHTWATRALERGIPDVQVAAMLGHKDTGMVHRHYSHCAANGRLLREAAERAAG